MFLLARAMSVSGAAALGLAHWRWRRRSTLVIAEAPADILEHDAATAASGLAFGERSRQSNRAMFLQRLLRGLDVCPGGRGGDVVRCSAWVQQHDAAFADL